MNSIYLFFVSSLLIASSATYNHYETVKWQTSSTRDTVYYLDYTVDEFVANGKLLFYKDSLYRNGNVDIFFNDSQLLRVSNDSIFQEISNPQHIIEYLDKKPHKPYLYRKMMTELDSLDYSKYTSEDGMYIRYELRNSPRKDILEFQLEDTTVIKHYRLRQKKEVIVTDTFVVKKYISDNEFVFDRRILIANQYLKEYPRIVHNTWLPSKQQLSITYKSILGEEKEAFFTDKSIVILGFQSCAPCYKLKKEIKGIIDTTGFSNFYYFSKDKPTGAIVAKDSITLASLNYDLEFGYIDRDKFAKSNGSGGYPLIMFINKGVLVDYIIGYNQNTILADIEQFLSN